MVTFFVESLTKDFTLTWLISNIRLQFFPAFRTFPGKALQQFYNCRPVCGSVSWGRGNCFPSLIQFTEEEREKGTISPWSVLLVAVLILTAEIQVMMNHFHHHNLSSQCSACAACPWRPLLFTVLRTGGGGVYQVPLHLEG